MDNFNFKKFLTENKLTKTSLLREGLEEGKEYTDRDEWRIDVKAKYPEAKPNPKFDEDVIYLDSEGNRVAMWSNDTNTGTIGFTAKPKDQSDLIYPKGSRMDEAEGKKTMSKNDFKKKIKEMIIAELSLAEGEENDVVANDYDPVYEGSDDEDYEKSSREVEFDISPEAGNEEFDLKDFFMDDEEDGGFENGQRFPGDNELDEAKKKKDDAPEEELDLDLGAETPEGEENLDLNIGAEDIAPAEDNFNIDTSAVDPNIKAVQDALTQAQAAAEKIQDEKLTQQIGNTITMFTRTHIANKEPIR